MTPDKLLSMLESYYGKYNPVVVKVTKQWLVHEKATPYALEQLFARVVQEHSSQWGKPPDVAILKPILKSIHSEEWQHALEEAAAPQLPDPTEVVDPADAHLFIKALFRALADDRDPRNDETIQEQIKKYGVAHG